MKKSKRIALAAFAVCVLLALSTFAVACGKKDTPASPKTYAVTYALGSYESTPYAGTSATPTTANKKKGESFKLADAPVWEGYNFLGWNDGTDTYGEKEDYTMPSHAVTFTAVWEKAIEKYAVTYALGRCNGEDYKGNGDAPQTPNKAANEGFNLAAAPVWADHTFLGWSDGTNLYSAGASYTMPNKAVTFTAQWTGYVTLMNYAVPTWNEGATTGGYEIQKGQHITISALIYKETGDSAYGINGKIFPDSVVDNAKTFYQFRCDFAVKRINWDGWNETNNGFKVDEGGFNREKYRESDEGYTKITVALSTDGVLTYTFDYDATWMGTSDGSYAHRRVFTDTVKMNSAVVLFGFEHAEAQPSGQRVHLTYPASDALTVTLDTNCEVSDWSNIYGGPVRRYAVSANSTFTIEDYNPTDNTGYEFLGWQVNGEGAYYKKGDTVEIGSDSIALVAAWRQSVTMTYDLDGGKGQFNPRPTATYNEETGKYDISGVPGGNEYILTKTGYRFVGWNVTVNGEPLEVDGPFSVDPGAVIVYTARWEKK